MLSDYTKNGRPESQHYNAIPYPTTAHASMNAGIYAQNQLPEECFCLHIFAQNNNRPALLYAENPIVLRNMIGENNTDFVANGKREINIWHDFIRTNEKRILRVNKP